MNNTLPDERLQPCLLDRLTDEHPESQLESREQRIVSMSRYREGVLRDLRWLLNCPSQSSLGHYDEFEEVTRSVLNFGIPDLCGLTLSGISVPDLEREVFQAIHCFEPRILQNTMSVRVIVDEQSTGRNSIGFEIKGELWATPMSDHLYVRTEIDLETGLCELEERPDG